MILFIFYIYEKGSERKCVIINLQRIISNGVFDEKHLKRL